VVLGKLIAWSLSVFTQVLIVGFFDVSSYCSAALLGLAGSSSNGLHLSCRNRSDRAGCCLLFAPNDFDLARFRCCTYSVFIFMRLPHPPV